MRDLSHEVRQIEIQSNQPYYFYSKLEDSDGQSFLFTPKKSGELIMTTNEPIGPDFSGYFDNNYGYVTFIIERVDSND